MPRSTTLAPATALRSPSLAAPASHYLTVVFAALAMFAFAASADAAGFNTYVASNGNDANACTVITAPCKTLQRAMDVTSDDGTIRVLTPLQDSVTVVHPITIVGDGVTIVGQITIAGGGFFVTLRGLVLDGAYNFVNGILINDAAAIHIEHCTVERYTGAGIRLAANGTRLFVSDTVSRDNDDGLVNDKANAQVTIENSRFENNSLRGISLSAARASAVRSVVSGSFYGIYLPAGLANIVETTVVNNGRGVWLFGSGVAILVSSVVNGNVNQGLSIGPGTTAIITNSTFTHNKTGIENGGGALYTRQNNTNNWNVTDYHNGGGSKIALGGF